MDNFNFAETYLSWLKSNIEQYKLTNTTYRITLPFLDRNNDELDIYIIDREDGTFLITDDGSTINELEFSGFDIKKSDKRKKILTSVISSCGVSVSDNNELNVISTMEDLPMKKHLLAQCMMKVGDMFYLNKPNVQTLFIEDVKNFLDGNNVSYVPDINFIGKSKLQIHYDFVIAKNQNCSERLISVVNNLDLNAARNIIFSWDDIKEMRPSNASMYTIIHDTENRISDKAIGALKEYNILPILWSERNQFIDKLIA